MVSEHHGIPKQTEQERGFMQLRWSGAIALWTILSGPVVDTPAFTRRSGPDSMGTTTPAPPACGSSAGLGHLVVEGANDAALRWRGYTARRRRPAREQRLGEGAGKRGNNPADQAVQILVTSESSSARLTTPLLFGVGA
jgi:hypothetical protein